MESLALAFTSAGLAEPQADAAILVEEATGLSRADLRAQGEGALGSAAAARLAGFAARRLAREPVFRIVGRRAFWSVELAVTPAVLDPRPDTETVIAAALDALGPRRTGPFRLLDLGTGSGAILCALLSECPTATGVGVDRSIAACRVAAANIVGCGLGERALVVAGDWAAAIGAGFDLVVSNPPYIETGAIAALDPEVREHDPLPALDGGADGLDAYRRLCPALPSLLRPDGIAVFEVGWTQASAVAAMFAASGFAAVTTRADLAGHARAVVGERRGKAV